MYEGGIWKEQSKNLMKLETVTVGASHFTARFDVIFIVIDRSCSESCGFDFDCRPGSFLRFNSRPIMYGAVGSLVLVLVLDNLGAFPSGTFGFNCVITLGNGYVRAICLS